MDDALRETDPDGTPECQDPDCCQSEPCKKRAPFDNEPETPCARCEGEATDCKCLDSVGDPLCDRCGDELAAIGDREAHVYGEGVKAGRKEVLDEKVPLTLRNGEQIHMTVREILAQRERLEP